jgi:hypothetical protein
MRSLRFIALTGALAMLQAPVAVLADGYDDAALSRSKRLTTFEKAYNKGASDALKAAEVTAGAGKTPSSGAPVILADDSASGGSGPVSDLGAYASAEVEPNLAVIANQEALDNIAKTEAQLASAKEALDESIRLQQEAVEQAQRELELAKSKAESQLEAQKIDPVVVRNYIVSGHFEGQTLKDIAQTLMPEGWAVRVHGVDSTIEDRRFEYVADSIARDKALYELTAPLGLRFKYFFGLTSEDGKSAPMLLIYDPRASLSRGG